MEVLQQWKRIFELGVGIKTPAKSRLSVQGQAVTDIVLIEAGLVELSYTDSEGSEASLGLRLPGQFVECFGVVLGIVSPFSAVALTSANIHRIDAHLFTTALETNATAATQFRVTITLDLIEAYSSLLDLKMGSAEQRLQQLMWRLARTLSMSEQHQQLGLRTPLSNTDIARLISVTPEHLSRIKKRLAKPGPP